MPLLDKSISIWDIALRWAGRNPKNPIYYLYIPLAAKDNIRLVLGAIGDQELYCADLSARRTIHFPQGTLALHVTEFDDCLDDYSYSRKFLKQIHVFRWEFARWCDEAGIPFPEFWFPKDWLADEPGYPVSLRRPEITGEDSPPIASIPTNINKHADGKRADTYKNWNELIAAAKALRLENASLSIAEVIRKIRKMSHLKAAANSEGTIRKKIAHLWPDEKRMPGRKSSKLG
jgi:hypothetical protein